MANKLVNWLYNEDGNIDIKNTLEGLNIYVQNNPIMYDSKIILTNNNPFVTVINLYLIDINGNKVANIFNGPISYGENTFSFNNDMMSSGKYMLILENTKGRQIGLPVMVVK